MVCDATGNIYIKAVRKRFINTFHERLKETSTSVLMLSASMILKGWDDRHAKMVGFEKADLKSYPAPFDYRRRSIVLLPSDTYSANDRKESIVERSEIIVKLAQKLNGRMLVLFNSRLRMENYRNIIAPMLEEIGLTLLLANDEYSIPHTNEFRKAGSGHILFGLKTLWEGIDIPGDALQCVIIESLPFKHPSDPLIALEAKLNRSIDRFEASILPDASSTLLQGCGRLLRTELDKGIIVILDKRIQYKSYAERMLSVLPEYPIIRDSKKNIYKHVEQFFQNDNHTVYDEADLEEWTMDGVKLNRENYYNSRSKILSFVQQRFRINRLKAWQENVIERIFTGEDVVCIKETGAGKSLCYQIPALMRDALSIVVTPINSLMRDQAMNLRELGFSNVGYLAADQDEFERQDTEYRLKKGELRLLYVSPERLTRERFKELVKLNSLGSLIVDEAHCISQWGHSFRLDFLGIGQFYKDNDFVNCAAFTATAPSHVLNDISMKLSLPNPTLINKLDARENLHFSVLDFSIMDKFELFGEKTSVLLQMLNDISGAVIVYTSTRNEAERLSNVLNDRGIPSAYYHAGMEPDSKHLVHERFQENGLKVIVATIAFGMGIDKSDVRAVIHFDVPGSPEAYYQEAGRAGRDGQNARCVLMYHPDNERTQKYFIKEMVYPREQVEDIVRQIREEGYRFFSYDKLNDLQEKEVMVLNYLTNNRALTRIQDVPNNITLKNRMLMAELYPEFFQDNMWLKENVNFNFAVLRKSVDDPKDIKKLLREWLGKSLIEASGWGNWYEPIKEMTLSMVVDSFPFKELEEIQIRSRDSFNKVLEYVRNKSECRYQFLSKHLGVKDTRSCGHCDICKSIVFPILEKQRRKLYNKRQVKREIISLIERFNGRSTKSYLINALVGEARNQIRHEHRLDKGFGVLSIYTYQEVNSVMAELIEEGFIISAEQYLSLTTLGKNLLNDQL
ncbi:RecQ family ATP-dependent DNA helicase [Paenibacillus albus]|uniref:ATP-dependent DNA helicase RecQ n=1 Tax=Paenibacillus albus TaxID=2495582 RepID=A0A3Q8X3W1_9BACL|nr:RecQ family ATP-dependent DNA helicase [Paenibacillus albus]AZN39554.1 RecQ family ATP-dependent DNA helicase [Paenibacillus albus]